MGRGEIWLLYLILSFFEGVSSSSSLEVSLVKSTKALLVVTSLLGIKLLVVVVVVVDLMRDGLLGVWSAGSFLSDSLGGGSRTGV
jgi:hypothetical protein